MDESTERLLAQMEQATSAQPTEPLDDETATLRESWLALGQLIEATDAEDSRPLALPRTARRSGLPLGLIAALAASLFVALAAWAMLNRGSDSVDPQTELAAPNDSLAPAPKIADVAEVPNEDESVEIVDELAWEDSFDERLADTSQAIRSVQADWNGGDQRYSVLLDQFERFNEELSAGSL